MATPQLTYEELMRTLRYQAQVADSQRSKAASGANTASGGPDPFAGFSKPSGGGGGGRGTTGTMTGNVKQIYDIYGRPHANAQNARVYGLMQSIDEKRADQATREAWEARNPTAQQSADMGYKQAQRLLKLKQDAAAQDRTRQFWEDRNAQYTPEAVKARALASRPVQRAGVGGSTQPRPATAAIKPALMAYGGDPYKNISMPTAPVYNAPAYNEGEISEGARKLAGGDIRRSRRGLQNMTRRVGRMYDSPGSARLAARGATEGYSAGLENIMKGAGQQALQNYGQKYARQVDNARTGYQGQLAAYQTQANMAQNQMAANIAAKNQYNQYKQNYGLKFGRA